MMDDQKNEAYNVENLAGDIQDIQKTEEAEDRAQKLINLQKELNDVIEKRDELNQQVEDLTAKNTKLSQKVAELFTQITSVDEQNDVETSDDLTVEDLL